MASKRERLSVKVGNAVGKLIAKHAPPEQIADLKAIGETAKKGDKMVSTAKLPDKPGTGGQPENAREGAGGVHSQELQEPQALHVDAVFCDLQRWKISKIWNLGPDTHLGLK
jgi:hypothetical protein